MNHTLIPCLAACALLALAACDRRVTYPPDESRADTTDVQPAGAAGDASRAADSSNPDERCTGLENEALRDCMAAMDAAREAADIRQ